MILLRAASGNFQLMCSVDFDAYNKVPLVLKANNKEPHKTT